MPPQGHVNRIQVPVCTPSAVLTPAGRPSGPVRQSQPGRFGLLSPGCAPSSRVSHGCAAPAPPQPSPQSAGQSNSALKKDKLHYLAQANILTSLIFSNPSGNVKLMLNLSKPSSF